MKNACIVGYGAIGPVHAKAIENIEEARVYAVCDIDSEKLERAKNDIKGIKTFKSFDDALSCDEIDCFHICTPHYLHFDMIEKALRKQKRVISEKPVTMTKTEFQKLLSLQGSEKVCVVFQNRYNPCVIKLREIIQNETYGKIKEIYANVIWKRDSAYYSSAPWRGTKAMEGGGVLINQAIHTLDLCVFLGGEVASLKASAFNFSLENIIEVEDTISAVIDFKNDIRGIFFATNAGNHNHSPEIKIIFESGECVYSNGNLCFNNSLICSDNFTDFYGKKCWGAGHDLLLCDFYKNECFISPHDIKNTMNTLFDIYESAAKTTTK